MNQKMKLGQNSLTGRLILLFGILATLYPKWSNAWLRSVRKALTGKIFCLVVFTITCGFCLCNLLQALLGKQYIQILSPIQITSICCKLLACSEFCISYKLWLNLACCQDPQWQILLLLPTWEPYNLQTLYPSVRQIHLDTLENFHRWAGRMCRMPAD